MKRKKKRLVDVHLNFVLFGTSYSDFFENVNFTYLIVLIIKGARKIQIDTTTNFGVFYNRVNVFC